MNSNLSIAKKTLLEPTGLCENDLKKILHTLLGRGIDWADIYFELLQHESWVLEDGIIKKGSFAIDYGAGVRAISDVVTGYAYVEDLSFANLKRAAGIAKEIANSGKTAKCAMLHNIKTHELYQPINPLNTISEEAKVNLLHAVNAEARNLDSRIDQVIVRLSASYKTILIYATDGNIAADIRPLVRMDVSLIAEENKRRESGYAGGGARDGYQFFTADNKALGYARDAVRMALTNLQAVAAPAGNMPVVLASGWPAVMIHEAVGHGLEGDFNRKKTSIYTDKIGQSVATPICTIIDNGCMVGKKRGSLNVDDEGTPTQCTTLIENGRLCAYMQDKFNARLMGGKSTGNGRRASYTDIPIPRMTNTYLLAGQSDPKDIIASIPKGLYAVNFSGGQVDITSGEFVFSTSEAYLIENGKVTKPIKDATLIGNGPAILNKITMVGNDLALDAGVGICGKDGQQIPVGVGQPTVKIAELTVGGTAG
jgi:TldD protein